MKKIVCKNHLNCYNINTELPIFYVPEQMLLPCLFVMVISVVWFYKFFEVF